MICYQDADVFQLQFSNNRLYFFYSNRIHACKGLIQQDKLGICCQCAGNFSPAAFPAREEVPPGFCAPSAG